MIFLIILKDWLLDVKITQWNFWKDVIVVKILYCIIWNIVQLKVGLHAYPQQLKIYLINYQIRKIRKILKIRIRKILNIRVILIQQIPQIPQAITKTLQTITKTPQTQIIHMKIIKTQQTKIPQTPNKPIQMKQTKIVKQMIMKTIEITVYGVT